MNEHVDSPTDLPDDPVSAWRRRWQSGATGTESAGAPAPVKRLWWILPLLAMAGLCAVFTISAQVQERWGGPVTPWGDNVYGVEVTNDTDQVIRARECKSTCRRFYYTATIRAGKTKSWGYSFPDKVAEWFLIESGDHAVIGCLRTTLAPGTRTTRVSVSQAMPCPEAILPAPTTTPTSVPATPDLSWSVV